MLVCPGLFQSSKPVMLVLENRVNVPPYVGLPSLSHHFPVADPVVEVVEVLGAVVFEVGTLEVVVVLPVPGTVVVVVEVVDVDVEPQEDNTKDITSRQLKIKNVDFSLILSPFFIFIR
jgi:hypothetical protein